MRPIELSPASSPYRGNFPIDAADLALTMVANFRAHPHVCNVMTHISGGNWNKVEKAMAAILDVTRTDAELSKLATNIVELICAESGTTGRILKPFFGRLLAAYLPAAAASEVLSHVTALSGGTVLPQAAPVPAEPVVVLRPQRMVPDRQQPSDARVLVA